MLLGLLATALLALPSQSVCERAVVHADSYVQAMSTVLDRSVQLAAVTNEFYAAKTIPERQQIQVRINTLNATPLPDLLAIGSRFWHYRMLCLDPFSFIPEREWR